MSYVAELASNLRTYMPHSTMAHCDEPLLSLRRRFGNDIYATYFILQELAYFAPSGRLNCKHKDIRAIYAGHVFAKKKVNFEDRKTFEMYINLLTKAGLFERAAWVDHKIIVDPTTVGRIIRGEKRRRQYRDNKRKHKPEKPDGH